MMDASKGVIANFSAVNHILAVKLINNNGGAGKITGVSAGLSDASSCSSECNKDYPIDSVVVLNASADTGSVFSGWSGDCSGKKLCLIMMNRPKNVNATFSKSVAVTHELSVIKAGTGGGTVQSSNISGINCGNDCISNFDSSSFVTVKTDVCIVPPNSFALARSIEYFRIPKDVLTICLGKSTYARCGIIVNVTPLEPEWEGHITLEFSNTTPLPAKIYAEEGAAQLVFLQAHETCEVSYKDRKGKYQGQTGVTPPRV